MMTMMQHVQFSVNFIYALVIVLLGGHIEYVVS